MKLRGSSRESGHSRPHRQSRAVLPAGTPAVHAGGSHRAAAAFTMVEIAIALAIIGFALVAIIGVLPAGMTVQKENREETIINQEASLWMNAIRTGARGLDDLTNYVDEIQWVWWRYDRESNLVSGPVTNYCYTWTPDQDAYSDPPGHPLDTGERIVGLLSLPQTFPHYGGAYFSNQVVATVHAISGNASEKYPQTNELVRQTGFRYRLVPEVVPFAAYDPSWTNFNDPLLSTNEVVARSNYLAYARALNGNLTDVKLDFRWPALPNGRTGPGHQAYRTTISGRMTNEFIGSSYRNYFAVPGSYAKPRGR